MGARRAAICQTDPHSSLPHQALQPPLLYKVGYTVGLKPEAGVAKATVQQLHGDNNHDVDGDTQSPLRATIDAPSQSLGKFRG